MKPLGDGFIKLIRMIIAPVIFSTVVAGIATMGDIKDLGRIGIKTLVYFEIVTTPLALAIALVVVNLLEPGVGINADPSTLDIKSVSAYASTAQQLTAVDFILNIIPTTLVDAFARGEILQVLLVSVLFGLALLHLGERGRPLVKFIDQFSQALFGVVGLIMRLAPIGAFGAMAFTIGTYGLGTLALARKADGRVLSRLPAVHRGGHGHHRSRLRLQPLEIPADTSRKRSSSCSERHLPNRSCRGLWPSWSSWAAPGVSSRWSCRLATR